MTDAVATTDLTKAMDAVRVAQQVAGNNLQLSDQIQFSRMLKHVMVGSHQETMETAEGPKDPNDYGLPAQASVLTNDQPRNREPDDQVAPEQRDYRTHKVSDVTDDTRSGSSNGGSDNQPTLKQDDRPKLDVDEDGVTQSNSPVSQRSETVVEDEATVEIAAPVAAPTEVTVPVELVQAVVPAPATAAQTTVTSTPTEKPAAPTPITSNTAQNSFASALTDDGFSDLALDLYDATRDGGQLKNQGKSSNSAASALRTNQQADLASRLGEAAQPLVQVTVNTDSQTVKPGLGNTLTAGAQLASLDIGDDAGNPSLLDNKSNGSNSGIDRSGRTVDPNIVNRGQGQPNQQAALGQFEQALKAQQAATLSAQQAASAVTAASGAKAQPIALDPLPLSSVTGPSGPSQLSQIAKANPTTATRHPLPQSTAEQIAVNISKAVGAGAEKINIKLNPAHLGRIEVRLEISRDGVLNAAIIAEKPETLEMLQRDSRGLEKALQDAGLKTNSDSLNFNLKEQGGNANQSDEKKFGAGPTGQDQRYDDSDQYGDNEGALNNDNTYGRNTAKDGHLNVLV